MLKMLPALLAMLMLAICQGLSAQDVVTLKTGEDLNVKVLEVGSTEVKYKKSDNPDGPSYTVAKADVFMIKYQNGSKDVFNAEEKKQEITANVNTQKQQDYDFYMRKFKKRLTSGIVCTAIGVPCLVTGAGLVVVGVTGQAVNANTTSTDIDYDAMGIIGGGLIIAGTALTITGPILIGTSFKYRKLAKQARASINFVPSIIPANGITGTQTGMAMRFTF